VDLMQFFSSQPAYVLWLLGGLVFLVLSLSAGGEPVVASLGLAALITAIVAITVSSAPTQFIIWGILSIALAVVLRGLVPKGSRDLKSNIEATVSETIPRGGIGLVSYEGALWKARSQISDAAIPPGKIVYVVGRQGLTLMVIPAYSEEETSDSP
jgi:membrane protein implicated in regulation of membrane protease activity